LFAKKHKEGGAVIFIGDISIDMPMRTEHPSDLLIEQAFDSHGRAIIKAGLKESESDDAIHSVTADSVISVKAGGAILFCGMPINVKTKNEGGLKSVELELSGMSKKLDVKVRSRSFQDVGMTFESLFKEIAYEYDGDILDFASNGAALGVPFIQYEETDWEFMKRLASRFGAPVFPFTRSNTPDIFIGLGKERRRDPDFAFDAAEIGSEDRRDDSEYRKGLMYRAELTEDIQIGDMIVYRGLTLVAARKTSRVKGGVLIHDCTFVRKEDAVCPSLCNRKIAGASMEGTVLDVSKDTVKLHLSADETQDVNSAFPFRLATPYTAEGRTGWYAMPEKGERLCLYMPTTEEKDAYARIACFSEEENEKHENPDVKIFETVHGNEMKLAPEELSFSGPPSGNIIKMTPDGGVEMHSAGKLRIGAGKNANLVCGTLSIRAGQSILLGGKTATLILDETVHAKG
jgi:hypothetical protein